MTIRIKITKQLLKEITEFLCTSDFITKARSEYLLTACEQILEDYDIVSNLGVNPTELIKNWKEKAEKLPSVEDSLLGRKQLVINLEQENKQLKDSNEILEAHIRLHENGKEKLEKFKMFFAQYTVENGEFIRVNVDKIKKILDED